MTQTKSTTSTSSKEIRGKQEADTKHGRKPAATAPAPDHARPIGIFVVDNQHIVLSAVQLMVNDTPEKDFVVVGSLISDSISPELPRRIQESCADVVLIDVAFGESEDNYKRNAIGIGAIRNVRRSLGSKIGIIAYTAYRTFEDQCLDAGADYYLLKALRGSPEAAMDLLRETIRTCKDHEVFSGIELIMKDRTAVLKVSRNNAEVRNARLRLNASEFALLYYLVQERAQNGDGWLAKELSDQKAAPFRFTNVQLWSRICEHLQPKDPEKNSYSKWDNLEVSQCACVINKLARGQLQFGETSKLIIVPGGGRKPESQDEPINRMYCLNEFIEPRQIMFTGEHQ